MLHWLYLIVVYPIEMLVEVAFSLFLRLLENPGPACIGVSVVISLLMLPMYRRADAIQEEERARQDEMARWVSHIKRAFSGDEQVMILSEYYRQMGYKPYYQLRSSLSLLLQIPFFMAAYNCLSSMQALQGASFLGISDLGAPDAMISLGGLTINVLPILMTAINAAACFVYNRDRSLREQIVPYGLALAFLILLYDRPAGLVLYWTCNQVFSLAKNVFMKVLKHPRKIAIALLAAVGTLFVALLLALGTWDAFGRATGAVLCALLLVGCWTPLAASLLARRSAGPRFPRLHDAVDALLASPVCDTRTFLLCCVFLTVLTGLLIPSSVIADSPTEFVQENAPLNPMRFAWYATCMAAGVFLMWAQVFHYLMSDKAKRVTNFLFFVLVCSAVANYMFFGNGLGNLNSKFVFDEKVAFPATDKLVNLLVLCLVVVAACWVWVRVPRLLKMALGAATVAALAMTFVHVMTSNKLIEENAALNSDAQALSEDDQILHLSRTGKNVVFLGIDRAVNADFALCLDERPELAEQFAGFTYYPNTMSFGFFTDICTASLFGGYEYSPAAINSTDITLGQAQNDALRVMPVSFADEGWDVTVCDPPYAGYQEPTDLSIFDEWDNIRAYHTAGAYSYDEDEAVNEENFDEVRTNRVFRYSVFKCAPLCVQPILYDDGRYLGMAAYDISDIDWTFVRQYAVLKLLPELTLISDDDTNCFVSLYNDTPHKPCILQLPGYEPAGKVDNSAYRDAFVAHLTSAEGSSGKVSETIEEHYMVNMASYIQIGKWLDYLRAEGVYDNTRIIIASDHGIGMGQFDYMQMDCGIDAQWVNPVLLFKDFGSTELTTSDEFMTNADVPTLALTGAVEKPTNPWTGKPITSEQKQEPQYLTTSKNWHIYGYNTAESKQLDVSDGEWYAINGPLFDSSSWTYEGDGQVPKSLQ